MMRRAADARKKQKEEGATVAKPRFLEAYSIEQLKVKLLSGEIKLQTYRHELDKRKVRHA
jgi:hypothetical protein